MINSDSTISTLITQAVEYQKQHDNIWDSSIATHEEYQTIKGNLTDQAKACTTKIKEYQSHADSTKADEYIKHYSTIIEVYREFYHY